MHSVYPLRFVASTVQYKDSCHNSITISPVTVNRLNPGAWLLTGVALQGGLDSRPLELTYSTLHVTLARLQVRRAQSQFDTRWGKLRMRPLEEWKKP